MPVPKNDALIPCRKAWKEKLGISVTTGRRLELLDPNFPKRVKMGAHWYLRLSEIERYIASLPRRETAA